MREYWDASYTQEQWNPFSRYEFHPDTEYEPWMYYAYVDGSGTFVPPFFRAEHGDAPGHAKAHAKARLASLRKLSGR